MQYITLHHFGPISECERLPLADFMVLTGPQAQGKSTIAKAIFFFQTIVQDIFAQMTQKISDDDVFTPLEQGVQKRLQSKFLRTFGSDRAMPLDMKMMYHYTENVSIEMVNLSGRERGVTRRGIHFRFSPALLAFFSAHKNNTAGSWDTEHLQKLRSELAALFDIVEKPVYVPAGRSMLTLLTDQLPMLFAEEDSHRTIDFCTQSYMAELLRLRNFLHNGLLGFLDEKRHLSQRKIDFDKIDHLLTLADRVLKGRYVYRDGEEDIIFDDGGQSLLKEVGEIPAHPEVKRYVKVNFASSGQQEAIWVFNILGYYLLERKSVFLLLEEPEAHLYPDAQKYIAEALALFAGAGNRMLLTTHSPYVLSELNNLLYANEVSNEDGRRDQIIAAHKILSYEHVKAYYVNQGKVYAGMDENHQIMSSLIDGAAETINEEYERLVELKWETTHGSVD